VKKEHVMNPPNGSTHADMIWRLDDENKTHEIEEGMARKLGYGNFVVTRTPAFQDDYRRYASEARGILLQVSFMHLGREEIKGLQSCKIISVTGGGFNHVDLAMATEKGIMVTYVPGYCLEEVSTHAVALMLALNQRLPAGQEMTRKGGWHAYGVGEIHRLNSMVLGILGLGRIGRAVARKAQGFGLTVKGFDPYIPAADLEGTGIQPVSFEELIKTSDFISLNLLLTKETRHLIDAKALASMKNTAYIINTCRGEVIDEAALVEALKAKKIGGAGLDVLTKEPPDPQNPLLNMPNVIVTPHSAFVSHEASLELKWRAIKAIADALEGRIPQDLINREVLNRRP